jgi:hypothetical protein
MSSKKLDIEKNPQSYSKLLFHIAKSKPLTRSSKNLATVSCRIWQFTFCMLTILKKYIDINIIHSEFTTEYNQFIELCKNICNQIIDIRYRHNDIYKTQIFNLLFMSNPNEMVMNYSSVDQLHYGNNYMCIHNTRGISHYFTIIKLKPGSRSKSRVDIFKINSSYGSDYVNIPQYTTLLNIQDLEFLLHALQDTNNNMNSNSRRFISYFYLKYFLQNNIYVPPTIEQIKGKELVSSYNKKNGPETEINIICNDRLDHILFIGIIPNYENYLESIIKHLFQTQPQQLHNGGRRKTKKMNLKL